MYSTFILYMRNLDTFQLYIEAILADVPDSLVYVSMPPCHKVNTCQNIDEFRNPRVYKHDVC